MNPEIYLDSAGKGNRQEPPSATSSIRTAPKGRTPSVPDLRNSIHEPVMTNGSALPPTIPIPAMTDNIRLCTINRADPDDTFGIELNYHRRDQYHSLSIISGRYNGPSSTNYFSFQSMIIEIIYYFNI